MSSEGVNQGRRRFVTGSVTVIGAAGAIAAAIPFIQTWQPSDRAKAAGAPVEVDISKLEPGQKLDVKWRGRPVVIVRRTDEMLEALGGQRGRLRDPNSDVLDQQPEYARNEHRSVRPDILVLLSVCTHLGCSPKIYPELLPQPFDSDWQGGFYCPCHNSRFDMAGRVYEGVPAPVNMKVPPYSFLDENRLLIGAGPSGVA